MLASWLEQNLGLIVDEYVKICKEAGDERPPEVIGRVVQIMVESLQKTLAEGADWEMICWGLTGRLLENGSTINTMIQGSRTVYKAVRRVLAAQNHPQQHELGIQLSDYVLTSTIIAAEYMETHFDQQVQARATEIQASTNFANKVIDSLPQMFFMYDMEGLLIRWNNVFEVQTGYNSDELHARPVMDFIAEPDREAVKEAMQGVFAGNDEFVEAHLLRKDGEEVPFMLNGTVTELDGAPCLLGTGVDLSQQKDAEAERERLHEEIIEMQRKAIQELSTPIIPLTEDILLLPLVGNVDSKRARDVMRGVLAGITQYRAKIVLIDITGVAAVDSGVAAHLNRTMEAARLKGATTILTGVSDQIAETVVDLGIDWSNVETLRDLQSGLVRALKMVNQIS